MATQILTPAQFLIILAVIAGALIVLYGLIRISISAANVRADIREINQTVKDINRRIGGTR